MSLNNLRRQSNFQSLVTMGSKGLYPLFDINWIKEVKNKKLSYQEGRQAFGVMEKLLKHKTPQRQQTLLCALEVEERNIFIRAIMKEVENNILDSNMELH